MSLVGFQARNHRQQVGRRGALDKVDDRRTPPELWELLNREFGFTLDVAASEANALCDRFYTIDDDALTQRWPGVVWCNPPYSNLAAWAAKAWDELAFDSGVGADVIVMLLPANRTEQAWWQDYIEPYRREGRLETRFLRGRLRFDTPEVDYTKQPKGNRPPFGNVLVIWRRAAIQEVAA